MAAHFGWNLRQLDVKHAFLHGDLNEEVYVQQPQGFIDSSRPNYVCRLLKSLYGLKQAPRAWFECFTSSLLTLGFVASQADSSLFILQSKGDLIYLLLYVDYIIITGTSDSYIVDLICRLQSQFDMTDLRGLKYFLGLEITCSTTGIYVSQIKYAHDILSRFGLAAAKSCRTPIALKHSSNDDFLCSDNDSHHFRALIDVLHYLTFSRPNISYASHLS